LSKIFHKLGLKDPQPSEGVQFTRKGAITVGQFG